MNAQIELIEGTNRDLSLSQFFTPPELAAKVVEWAGIADPNRGPYKQPYRVLEPSAGNGALVRPVVAAGAIVHAFEIDERYKADLGRETGSWGWVHIHNFLECDPVDEIKFDLCVMNPPYEDGKDVAFILHALKFAPRVVGIFRADLWYGVERYDELWSQVRPTRVLNLKRRWFKNPQTGKGGETNYVCLELVKRGVLDKASTRPDQVSMEWW
jgi:predicted RNA methylase